MLRFLILIILLFSRSIGVAEDNVQYGGDLNVGTVNVTLSALSWDPRDWVWKANHDAGAVREQLFVADLSKSRRNGGKYGFVQEAYLPTDSIKGELAESWYWEDDLTLVVNLRQDVFFPDHPGLMKSRLLTADDVVFSYNFVDQSPKKILSYFDHIDRVVARDKHTVVFEFNQFHAEWAYRYGYGYHSAINPRELSQVDPKDWRNVAGSGPFGLEKYVQSNAQIYKKNPIYWGSDDVDGKSYQLPFVDRVIYRIIKDEATFLTALRTGQLDILEAIRWIAVDHLKETTPELQWNRWLGTGGTFVSLRVDQKPFDDVRVRRALNLAINQQEIADVFYGGHAELMAYPQHPDFGDYFQPLSEMPEEIQELFTYNPEKAKALLSEAGVPEGFRFNMQVCSCNPSHMDLIPLLESYLSKVGIQIVIQPMEYASFFSAMTTKTHGPGYLVSSGHVNPLTTLRKSFVTGQKWNPSQYSSEYFDKQIDILHNERDEQKRIQLIRHLTRTIMSETPYIWLPVPYVHTAWWPWVKNYGGELRAGANRPGPIYARIWIDQELKEEMGF